jgi:hypothetical protein
VDHKSDAIEDPVQGFLKYAPQLEAYAQAVEEAGTPVAGVAVHWIRRGEVATRPTRHPLSGRTSEDTP